MSIENIYGQLPANYESANDIESKTFHAVNNLRFQKKLAELPWDSVLYRAALDHAQYLGHQKEISHFQNTKERYSPTNRVKLHGGYHYTLISENIVSIPLNNMMKINGKVYSSNSKEAAAMCMALSWRYSPKHYENILNKKVNRSALAIWYDKKNNRLIAVQVFGESSAPLLSNIYPDYSEMLETQKELTLPYKLKSYKPSKRDGKKIKLFQSGFYYNNCYILPRKSARKLFRGRRSGIAQEFIPLSQYDSNDSSFNQIRNRRNGLYELNGKLAPPFYKRDLFQFWRKNCLKTDYYLFNKIKLKRRDWFYFPLYENDSVTSDYVHLLRRKKLIYHEFRTPVEGEIFRVPWPDLPVLHSIQSYPRPNRYSTQIIGDTIEVKLFYNPGKTDIDSMSKMEIQKRLDSISGKIMFIEARAFASIEGDLEENKKLANERLKKFMPLIQSKLDSSASKPTLTTNEQWNLFFKQIKGTPLYNLRLQPKDSIRAYVNKHKFETNLSNMLYEQRYISFRLIWKNEIKTSIPFPEFELEYDSLLYLVKQSKNPPTNLLDSLERCQLRYYDFIKKQTPPYPNLEIYELEKYPVFKYHRALFQYEFCKSSTDPEFYYTLHEDPMKSKLPASLKNQALYNNYRLVFREYLNFCKFPVSYIPFSKSFCNDFRRSEFQLQFVKKMTCKSRSKKNEHYYILSEIPKFSGLCKQMLRSDTIEKRMLQFYILELILTQQKFPVGVVKNAYIDQFKKYFHPIDSLLSNEERMRYAKFYAAFLQYEKAKELIKPVYHLNTTPIEMVKFYISLLMTHQPVSEMTNILLNQFDRLGKTEWCNLIKDKRYINFLTLEDPKLKYVYNCNCQ